MRLLKFNLCYHWLFFIIPRTFRYEEKYVYNFHSISFVIFLQD